MIPNLAFSIEIDTDLNAFVYAPPRTWWEKVTGRRRTMALILSKDMGPPYEAAVFPAARWQGASMAQKESFMGALRYVLSEAQMKVIEVEQRKRDKAAPPSSTLR